MPRAPAPVTSSTSACRGLAVKNTPEPVDVVDRAEQGLDLPLLAAVRPGVHVPDVHAAAQRGGPLAQPGAGRLDGLVGLREFGDDQAGSG